MPVYDDSEKALNGFHGVESGSTIASIVTSVGGPPGAVGIVRLSGPSAVAIVGTVFRPARKKRKKNSIESFGSYSWRPISHVVEYGEVRDSYGSVVDEVCSNWNLLLVFGFMEYC